MAGVNLLSGFLHGMAEAKRNKKLEERYGEELDYKKRVLKNQEDALKLKQEAAAKKQAGQDQFLAMISSLAGGVPQAPQAPQPPPRMAQPVPMPEGGLTDQIAKEQVRGKFSPIEEMDPAQAALIRATGKSLYDIDVDLPAAQRVAVQRRGQELRERSFKRGEEEGTLIERELPSGEKVTYKVGKYGTTAKPVTFEDMQVTQPPKLQTRKFKKGGDSYEVEYNPRTGEDVGTPRKIESMKGASAESSAKISMGIGAARQMPDLVGSFYNDDGSLNKQLIFQANSPVPIGEGRLVKQKFLDILDARMRAATGAAIGVEEEKRYMGMYFPSVLDSKKTVDDKMKRLEVFMNDYLNTLDPSGNIRARTQGANPTPQTQADYDALPSGTVYIDPDDGKAYRKP